jgi:hypothetical protein
VTKKNVPPASDNGNTGENGTTGKTPKQSGRTPRAASATSDPESATRVVTKALDEAKRDEHGFLVGAQPHLTEQQFLWLTYRMASETDKEANDLSGVTPDVLARWRENPDFTTILDGAMGNKREAFRQLGGHMLPKVLRTLYTLLDDPNTRVRVNAAGMILRTQALLVDKANRPDNNILNQLIVTLREARPYQTRETIDGEFRQIDVRPYEPLAVPRDQ